jgi:acetylornithine deacetylase/succinyl-diaminopimelate desuccinylase-like protein
MSMRHALPRLAALVLLLASAAPAALAAPEAHAPSPTQVAAARALLARSVAFQTVEGRGQVKPFAEMLAGILRDAGFPAADVSVVPMDDTAYFTARLRGTGTRRPILISAHMDVVEARREDWERDPFTLTEENGFLFGRGTSDMKTDLVGVVMTLARLKQEGFRPSRDILLVFSGDEETGMKTTAALARLVPDAEFMLNADAGGGVLSSDGRPLVYYLQAAEKTYADFWLTATSPGGHSSRPTPDNPIYRMGAALQRLAAHQFPVMSNEVTLASLKAAGAQLGGTVGAAMQRFAAHPSDTKAAATISADPAHVGQLRTTCVATTMAAGHAPNALPQSATVNVNCRIFPGVPVADVQRTLDGIVADPAIKVELLESGTIASDVSPLRPDVMAALRRTIDLRYPGIGIVPAMSAGATDSMHFRAAGIPSYGTSSIVMREEDNFAHGLNERVPAGAVGASLLHWHALLTDLAR